MNIITINILEQEHHPKSCFTCKNLSKGMESWEHPEFYWYECTADKKMENLKWFPTKNKTKCKKWAK